MTDYPPPGPAEPKARKPLWKKKRVWVPAVLLLLLILAPALGGGSNEEDSSTTAAAPAASPTASAGATSTTPAPATSATTAPSSAAPAAPAVEYAGKLKGDKLAGGAGAPGSEVQLSGWTTTASPLRSVSGVLGKNLCADVTLVNRDDEQQDYNGLSWKLQTPSGNVQDMTYTGDNDLMSGGLAPGGTVSKSVCFSDESAGAGQYVLSWQPDIFGSKDRGVWLNTV